MPIMTVRDVCYEYIKGKPVLKNVDLDLEQGLVYCIFGPSGCGKTTLLSLMGGLDVPTSGEILFGGKTIKEIGDSEYRRHCVSFVFQNYNLIDYMTPEENVRLTTKETPLKYLTQVGLKRTEARRNVMKLSGGQQQRVAIARALASGAPVILADEPTGNLDEDTADEIIELLKQNARELNRCVVIVSHSNAVAEASDIVLELSHGLLNRVK